MCTLKRFSFCFIMLSCVVGLWSNATWAQDKAKPKKEAKPRAGQPVELGPIVVTARPTRPSAVVELGKLLPEVKMSAIRQPFLSKIEKPITREPF